MLPVNKIHKCLYDIYLHNNDFHIPKVSHKYLHMWVSQQYMQAIKIQIFEKNSVKPQKLCDFTDFLPDIDFFHRDSDEFDSMDKGDIHRQHRGKLFHICGIHNLIFFDISLDIAIHLHCNLSIFGFFDIYIIEHSFCYKEGIRLRDMGLNIYVVRKTIIFHMVFHKTKIFQSIF